jgi:hypothetical protein
MKDREDFVANIVVSLITISVLTLFILAII